MAAQTIPFATACADDQAVDVGPPLRRKGRASHEVIEDVSHSRSQWRLHKNGRNDGGPFRLPTSNDAEPGSPCVPEWQSVRLRSGGPSMTVKGIKGHRVDCFCDVKGQINADRFPVDVLRMG